MYSARLIMYSCVRLDESEIPERLFEHFVAAPLFRIYRVIIEGLLLINHVIRLLFSVGEYSKGKKANKI